MEAVGKAHMKWWQGYELAADTWARWIIGPLELFGRGSERDWVFAWRWSDDPLDDSTLTETAAAFEPDQDEFEWRRFALAGRSTLVTLAPKLGDRAFVVSPEIPLFVLPGEETLLYLSTPVWVSISVGDGGDPAREAILDIPTFRPSDTWFGADTRDGELCYATRTNARMRVEEINRRPHRAVTQVEIRNELSDNLPVEQLRVPVTALSLYEDAEERLWTDALTLLREEGEARAAMSVHDVREIPERGSLLAEPRAPVEDSTIVQAFSKLLS